MLTNLLRTAAQYDALPALLASITTEITVWIQAYQTLPVEHPILASFVQPWVARAMATITMIAQIDVAIATDELAEIEDHASTSQSEQM
jgi:hypothetical protein